MKDRIVGSSTRNPSPVPQPHPLTVVFWGTVAVCASVLMVMLTIKAGIAMFT